MSTERILPRRPNLDDPVEYLPPPWEVVPGIRPCYANSETPPPWARPCCARRHATTECDTCRMKLRRAKEYLLAAAKLLGDIGGDGGGP